MIGKETVTLRILGRGWSMPVLPEAGSARLKYVAGTEKVRQSILTILETEPGERLMRPTFGCGLRRYLMKPNTAATRALIRHDVEVALTTWEPRIQLQSLVVEAGTDPALVWIGIHYVHRHNAQPDNLVYPLYLE
jgi:uncharacterized protein